MQCESGWGYLVCVHILAGLAPCNLWLAEISCWAEIVSTILGMDKINLNSSMDPRTQGFGYTGTVLTALATDAYGLPPEASTSSGSLCAQIKVTGLTALASSGNL